MARDALLEQLERSPKLPWYVRQAQHLLDEERKKRERFYETVREDQKAEFINGEVVIHSPAKFRHTEASENLFMLLSAHVKANGLGIVAHEKLMISLTRNDYEPDIAFFGKTKAKKFSPQQWKFPAPDFIAEVLSDSAERADRGVKFEDYADHGIAEYWIVDPKKESVEQYLLRDEQYVLNSRSRSGEIQSRTVEAFKIPIHSIFDAQENLKVLRALLGGR